MLRSRILLLTSAVIATACAPASPPVQVAREAAPAAIDSARLMNDLRILAADTMEGRQPGTPGGLRAQRFLLQRFREIGLTPVGADFGQPFTFTWPAGGEVEAVNIVGYVRGSVNPNRYIVVTAHYDHLGVRNGQIFHGADDNASGTAALLELARHFTQHRPRNSIVFAALDAEEGGLRGARFFVRHPPVPLEAMVVNVNMDMVGRNDQNELYAAGTYHYPFLRPYLERITPTPPVQLRFGHDSPDLGDDDWTLQSDHGAFHEVGIPFIYFGVEDHPDYHRPTDTADRIQPVFYTAAVATVLSAVQAFDRNLDEIAAASRR
jgi:Zn-dependent M28 family amino/carboxypeptidase